MKARTKRLLGLLLAGIMVVSLAAGCGNNAAESTTDTSADDNDTNVENPAGEDETAEDGLSGKIVISTTTSAAAQAAWEALEKAYEEMHPGVDVVVDLKAEDGYQEWADNVFNNADTTEVDIVNINFAKTSSIGKRINFNDYVSVESPYSDGTWEEQFNYSSQVQDHVAEEMFQLSLSTVQVMWFYNQEIFEEVGVEPPETWTELIEVCEKIAAAGYQPIAMAGDYASFNYEDVAWLTQIYIDSSSRSNLELIRAQEGDYCYDPDVDGVFEFDPTDPWNDEDGKVNINPVRLLLAQQSGEMAAGTPGNRTVFSEFSKVIPQYCGGENMFGTDHEGAQTLFYQGKAAMFVDGGWQVVKYMNSMKELKESGVILDENGEEIEGTTFTLGSFVMPSMEGEGIEAAARSIEVPNGFIGAVSKDIEHDELVMDFIMYYSSAEGYSVYLNALLANGGSVSGPSLVYDVEYPEEIAAAFANTKYIGNAQKETAFIVWPFSYSEDAAREFYDNALAYFKGEKTLDEFVELHQQYLYDAIPYRMETMGISASDMENPAAEPTGE